MLDELNAAIQDYKSKWEAVVAGSANADFFSSLKPTSAAWKTEDLADYDKRFADLRASADHIHIAWLNGRWLATFHLRDGIRLAWGMEIALLMQRRPGSADAVGLDHLDFRTPPLEQVEHVVKADESIQWTHEENTANCKWISIWFAGTEAKLRPYTKIDVGIAELQAISKRMQAAS